VAAPKTYLTAESALADVFDGAVVLVTGFAGHGVPQTLLRALAASGARGLTCICAPAAPPGGVAPAFGVSQLVAAGQVSKLITPMPAHPEEDGPVAQQWQSGDLEVEIVPQGVLAERMRAGGAGLGGVFLSAGAGARFHQGKELREINGRQYALETPIKADFALVRAHTADTLGNLIYQGTGRAWGPVMAPAARITIAEVDHVVEAGGLDPEKVITHGIFVHRIVQRVAS